MSQADFERLGRLMKSHMAHFSNDQKGHMYGLFKQATMGDCPHESPPAVSVLASQKHAAWAQKRGMSQRDARESYVRIGLSFEEMLRGAKPA